MSRISFFCTTMRRFFHRKNSQQARPSPTTAAAGSGGPQRPRSSSSSSSTNSPVHAAANTATTRVRAPALRSRSMSVLNGPALPPSGRRFTRSLSFCAENQMTGAAFSRQMTQSEEDEVFRTYTRRVYGLFGVLCAVIVGLAAYAYLYNYGNR